MINYKTDTKKGKYKLIHPEKYLGSKIPIYRSLWEKKFFNAMDKNPYILKWGSEVIEIYYHHPIYNNFTVYYPDIFCHALKENGNVDQLLIEIKPAKMCILPKEPSPPKNKTTQSWQRYQNAIKRFHNAQKDYLVNMAKWEAAQRWCMKRGVLWRLANEKNMTGLF